MRGSSVFGGDADALIRAERKGNEYLVHLTMAKPHKDAPEWDHPRYAKLSEEILPGGGTTLVARAPADTDLPAKGEAADELHLSVLDRELGKVLQANPTHTWTQADLAAALAQRENVGLPEKKIKDTYLKLLYAGNGTIANRCYDPMRSQKAGRWTWADG